MPLVHGEERPNPAVLAFLEAVGRREVPLAIADRDEMLGHLLRAHLGSVDAALVGYFRTGLMAAEGLERVLRWRFGERAGVRTAGRHQAVDPERRALELDGAGVDVGHRQTETAEPPEQEP